MNTLKSLAFGFRKDIVNLVYHAKTGHIGGDMSVCDILTVLYFKHMNVTPDNFKDKEHDRFILSKGHSVEALYSVLAGKGFFPKEDLQTFSQYNSLYIGHPNNKIGGIEMNSGSLGHGLPVAVGMAIAGKLDQKAYRVYTVMGDGELAEGSVWEGAMAAAQYGLDNLCAVVDRNRLQISGTTQQVMGHENLEERWASFGWHTITVNGNDTKELDEAFTRAKQNKGKPTVVIANTVKGFGVSFMENQAQWHHKVPTQQEYEQAMEELEARRAEADEYNSKPGGDL